MLLLVLVLAVTSLLAAAAYNTATVVNAGTITINNTNASLLALSPLGGVGNKDNTAKIENGMLKFEFGTGTNPYFNGPGAFLHGMQKKSTYIWGQDVAAGANIQSVTQGLFSMQNRSAETIVTSIQVTGLPEGVKLYMAGTAGFMNTWVDMSDGNYHNIMPWGWGSVGSGNTVNVAVKIVVEDTATFKTTTSITINVKADAI